MKNMNQTDTHGYRTHFLKLKYAYSIKQEHLCYFFKLKTLTMTM